MNKLSLKVTAKPLSDLVSTLGVYSEDVSIHGISDDTRTLQQGDAFLCLPRAKDIGALVAEAEKKGASAIIFVGKISVEMNLPCACLPDMQATGLMLRRWFETEDSCLPCIGITGTDGKTSTAWMLREVLEKSLGSAWSCGTLGLVRDSDDITDLGNTTPSLLTLHTLLALALQAKVGALILEVSSHGIAQERIAGIPFSAAIWTTMGQDHLEDHGGFEPYLACKSDFITSVARSGGIVVANAGYTLIQQSLQSVEGKVFWYAKGQSADLNWNRQTHGIVFADNEGTISLKHMPVADFHAENLAAIVLLMKQVFHMGLAQFVSMDGQVTTPMGRLEPVDASQQVFIDYAHTAEGLSRCLQSAKDLTRAQLLLVFGCGGDRDKAKRPAMGAVASEYADECWLTSDNPRSEKQSVIAEDVLQGMNPEKANIHVCHNRETAIYEAVAALHLNDVLVIAGKGHELYMEIHGERLPWSDKATALAAIQAKEVRACA